MEKDLIKKIPVLFSLIHKYRLVKQCFTISEYSFIHKCVQYKGKTSHMAKLDLLIRAFYSIFCHVGPKHLNWSYLYVHFIDWNSQWCSVFWQHNIKNIKYTTSFVAWMTPFHEFQVLFKDTLSLALPPTSVVHITVNMSQATDCNWW